MYSCIACKVGIFFNSPLLDSTLQKLELDTRVNNETRVSYIPIENKIRLGLYDASECPIFFTIDYITSTNRKVGQATTGKYVSKCIYVYCI